MRPTKWIVGVLIVLGVACCLMTAIPNYLHIGTRSKAAEARTNLRAVLAEERSFFAKEKHWARSFEELGFFPEFGNRYRLALSQAGEVLERGPSDGGAHAILAVDSRYAPREPDSVHAAAIPRSVWEVTDGGLTIVATGNIDADPTLDVWSISSEDRVIDGKQVAAGVEWCHLDDSRN